MYTIRFLSDSSTFFGDTFFTNPNGESDSADVTAFSPTQLIAVNDDNGMTVRLTGSGFQIDPVSEEPTGGTISSISFSQNGTAIADLTGLDWSLVTFGAALDAAEGDDLTVFANLLSRQPITLDATTATGPLNLLSDFQFVNDLVRSDITIQGSAFDDTVTGGLGDDTINIGTAESFQFIWGSPGNDLYNIPNLDRSLFTEINYRPATTGTERLTFTINGETNTATVQSAAGWTDTFSNILGALNADGMSFTGSFGNDVFNIVNSVGSWLNVAGGEGNDTYNITANDNMRISFNYDGSNAGPTEAVRANLATGVVSQDGFGGTDQINVQGGTARVEVRLTQFADNIVGSARNDSFITEGGNDTIDGGVGFDRVRYDRSGMENVVVDLEAETATGVYRDRSFTQTLTDIEFIRGSRQDGSEISGSDADERFEGDDFGDQLNGRGGSDELLGYAGNDTLIGGDGRDNLQGGDGDDLIDASGGTAVSQVFGDYIRPGLGVDTILGHEELWATGEGIDISYADIDGVGVNIVVGETGAGTARSRQDSSISDNFTFAHYFEGSGLADRFESNNTDGGWRGFVGLAGADTIVGNGAFDTIRYNTDASYGGEAGVVVNFVTGRARDGFGDLDIFTGIEGARGTESADTFRSTENADDFFSLEGGDGADTYILGAAEEFIDAREIAHLQGDVIQGFGDNDTIRVRDPGAMSVALDYNAASGQLRIDLGGNGSFEAALTLENGPDALTGVIGDDGDLRIVAEGGDDGGNGDGGNGDGGGDMGGGDDVTVAGATNGADSLTGTNGDDVFDGLGGNDTLVGLNGDDSFRDGSGNDLMLGGLGNDTWLGGTGQDTFDGGAGDDKVMVDLTESPNPGSFIVEVNLLTGDSGARGNPNLRDTLIDVEHYEFDGAFDVDVFGNTEANSLVTSDGEDTLNGWSGDDTLDGGEGADLLIGGQGSDVIYVDDVGDRVAESRKWAGSDTVISSVDFRMGRKHIEDLELTDDAQLGAGNGLRNTITGNDADNTLDGGKNVDTLIGGLGDDRYLIRAPGDNAVEQAGEGIDTVLAFRAYALDANIERLFLQTLRNDAGQGVAGVNGIGNDLDNTIVGNPFDNVIVGREGSDTLRGQAGADTFVFDRALGPTNVDRIVDFNTNEANEGDILRFKQSEFAGVVKGTLAEAQFVTGTAAQDANDRFVFDQMGGRLWFDVDGAGGAAQQLVATFDRNANVTADDIELF